MATTEATLNPELAGLEAQFNEARDAMRELVRDLSDEDFNWRPGGDQWSAAECIDHLVVLGNHMLRQIDAGIEAGRDAGWRSNGPFTYGRIGNWFVRAVGPRDEKNKRKFKAPNLYTPTSNHSISRLEAAFIELQDEFVDRLHQANGLDLAKIKLPSPVSSLLKFSLGQWLALLAGHQMRHFQQAQGVIHQLRSQSS